METVHAGSPTKHPARRLETIEAAGELKFRSRAGSSSASARPRTSASPRSRRSRRVHARHGHIQEVIIQNFVPHPRYHGREVADIAGAAADARWEREGEIAATSEAGERRTAAPPGSSPVTGAVPLPEWANAVTLDDLRRLVRECRRLMPDVGIQIPPEPLGLVAPARARGSDGPRRPLRERRSHLARASVPEPAPDQEGAEAGGIRADRAPVRLPAIHIPGVDGAGGARHGQVEVLVVHPPEGLRQAGDDADSRRCRASGDREGARQHAADARGAHRPLRGATPRRHRGHAARRRRAEGAARRRHRHLRRQPQHQLHQHLPGRLRVLRLRAGQALARRLPRPGAGLRRQGEGGGRLRRHRDLHAGRDPPRLHALGLRQVAEVGQGDCAGGSPARVLADGGPFHVRALREADRRLSSST